MKVGRDHPAFDAVVTRVTSELDRLAETAKSARGEARASSIARLAELDADLMAAARATVSESAGAALQREVDAELAGFCGTHAGGVDREGTGADVRSPPSRILEPPGPFL